MNITSWLGFIEVLNVLYPCGKVSENAPVIVFSIIAHEFSNSIGAALKKILDILW